MNGQAATCWTCGKPATNVVMIDGIRDGVPFGETRYFCDKHNGVTERRRTEFGDGIRQFRVAHHLGLAEIAERVGVTSERLSGIEHGRYTATERESALILSGYRGAGMPPATVEQLHKAVHKQRQQDSVVDS